MNLLVEKFSKPGKSYDISDIGDNFKKSNMAQLLENQMNYGEITAGSKLLKEAVNTTTSAGLTPGGAGHFSPIAMAIHRRAHPDLLAYSLTGVQAMKTYSGVASAIRYTYDGEDVETGFNDMANRTGYTGSGLGKADDHADNVTRFNTARDQWITDNAVDPVNPTASETEIAEHVARAVISSSATTQQGEDFSFEAGQVFPKLNFKFETKAILAGYRSMATSYSVASIMDAMNTWGVDVERGIVENLHYEVLAEADRETLLSCIKVAVDTSNGGDGVRVVDVSSISTDMISEKYLAVLNAIIKASVDVKNKNRRGAGNVVIVSTRVATILESLNNRFTKNTTAVDTRRFASEVGTINGGRIKVFLDSYATEDYALVAYVGQTTDDAGVITSPYVMGLELTAQNADNFSANVGVQYRYAITDSLLGAGNYYTYLKFDGLSAIIGL